MRKQNYASSMKAECSGWLGAHAETLDGVESSVVRQVLRTSRSGLEFNHNGHKGATQYTFWQATIARPTFLFWEHFTVSVSIVNQSVSCNSTVSLRLINLVVCNLILSETVPKER